MSCCCFAALSPSFTHLCCSLPPAALLFMQDPNRPSNPRKSWYQRVIQAATVLWKGGNINSTKPEALIPSSNESLWKTISRPTEITNNISNSNRHSRLRKCTSLKVASSFTRVCLCAPISSYTEIFQADHYVPPRRSNSYPRSKPAPTTQQEIRTPSGRISVEGRKIFRGKSLTDDVLMRRFVIEEEAMMQLRKRNEMEIIRRRSSMRRKRIGPSPLSRMVLAEEEYA